MNSLETTTARLQVERPSLSVPRSMAETAIQRMVKAGILDRHLFVNSNDETIVLPLLRKLTEDEIEDLQKLIPDASSGTEHFEPRARRPRTLDESLAGRVPPRVLARLPKSFDIVGDITILELDPELTTFETSVAEAIMEIHPNVRAVFAKGGEISGAERIRSLRHVAGENRTLTIHKEQGCLFKIDLSKVFFSPRLSTEHQRVAQMVGKGERIVDMFAGVGPFSILIAKRVGDVQVDAIDANREAVELIRENVRENKVESKVHAHLGDARDVIRAQLTRSATRVIMNHPSASKDFVKDACNALQPSGGIIHYYTFAGENWEADSRSEIQRGVEGSDHFTGHVLETRRVREVAPLKWQVAADVRVVPHK